ncbi:MAG: carboxymuconolactone decarboxylase family protein [Vicinamibacteria bacterium]
MSDFTVHTIEKAPAASVPWMQKLQEQAGFVPNLAATMAGAPALLEAFMTLRGLAARGPLSAPERELLAVTVAGEIACRYCFAAHSTFAQKVGASPADVAAVRSGEAAGDARQQALLRFARAVARREDAPAAAQDLVRAGYTREQVLEVLVAIAVPMLAGLVDGVAEVAVDGAFAPNVREAVAR